MHTCIQYKVHGRLQLSHVDIFTVNFDRIVYMGSFWFFCLLQKGQGAPGRESVFSEEEKKEMKLHAYHRQEELKVRTRIYVCTCTLASAGRYQK